MTVKQRHLISVIMLVSGVFGQTLTTMLLFVKHNISDINDHIVILWGVMFHCSTLALIVLHRLFIKGT